MSYTPKHEPASGGAKKPMDAKKKQKIGIIALLAALAVIVVVMLVLILNGGKGSKEASPLYPDGVLPTSGSRHDVNILPDGGKNVKDIVGLWDVDGTTKYRFDGTGRGILYTAVDEYSFVYSAENGVLDIDFDVDRGTDAEYTYTINGDTLTISRGTNTYEMSRVIE